MAIAKMRRIVIVTRSDNKDELLEQLQCMRNVQIEPLDAEDDTLFLYTKTKSNTPINDITYTQLRDIEQAIDFLQDYVPQDNMLKQLAKKRPEYSLEELGQLVQASNPTQLLEWVHEKRQGLETIETQLANLAKEEDMLRRWQKLDMLPKEILKLKYFTISLGTVDTEKVQEMVEQLQVETEDQVFLNEIYYSEDTTSLVILYPKEWTKHIRNILEQWDFDFLSYEYNTLPQEQLQANLAERRLLLREQKETKLALRTNKRLFDYLILAQEYYANLIERNKAAELVLQSHNLLVIQGWLEENLVEDTRLRLHQTLQDLAYLSYEVNETVDDLNKVPTKLINNAFNQPFESFTLQYGVPKYDSIDPTPFFSLFQVLFFGLMSADVGYGLLLFLVTVIPVYFWNINENLRQTLRGFNYMAIGTMGVGLFFGSFFGFDLPWRALGLTDNILGVMIFSVALGIVHMILAYALKAGLAIKARDYTSLYLDSIQWIMMLIGVVVLAANLQMNSPMLNYIGLILLLCNILGMVIVKTMTHKNPLVGFASGLFGLMDVASMIGDMVSYTRLAAIAVAGANIAMAFNLIIGLLPPIARFTVGLFLFIALHALNIFISFLGAYVHSMRLEFVEFFGKFYETGGKLFTPLKPQEKAVRIKEE